MKKEYEIFNIDENFVIECGMNEDVMEAWIYHKDFGVKMFITAMVGLTANELFDKIDIDDAKETYEMEYMN